MTYFEFFFQISPRRILEEYIESKTRKSFVDFGGLTSTPKKSVSGSISEGFDRITEKKQTSSSLLYPPWNEGASWGGRGRRSASSPLLHPGRLGHHDTLVKSVNAGGHNGAAVPLLQSPLLRLARGQDGPPPRRVRSQGAVSAGALPTAVSPLLVNVRGSRQLRGNDRDNKVEKRPPIAKLPVSPLAPVGKNIISGMNGVYKKFASEELIGLKSNERVTNNLIPRSQTSDNPTVNKFKQFSSPTPVTSDCTSVAFSKFSAEAAASNSARDITSKAASSDRPRSGSRSPRCGSAADEAVRDPVGPEKSAKTSSACSASRPSGDPHGVTVDFLEQSGNLREEFFCDLVTSTPKKSSLSSSNNSKKRSQLNTLKLEMQSSSKRHLINGALLTNNNFSPLDENDFDESFDKFPWIGESLDT